MRRRLRPWSVCALLLALSLALAGRDAAHAADLAKPDAKPEAKSEPKPEAKADPKPEVKPEAKPADAPATYTVKREPLKIELTLKGTFEAAETAEIALRPEVWTTLEVQSAVAHGAAVKKGDVLIQFDLKKIDDEIAEVRFKQAVAELAFQQAQEALKATEAVAPLDAKLAERSGQMAREDREKFVKTDRPMAEKAAKMMLEMTEQSLEYEREELKQLEKMYKADDLTEETEEIVLKRQRNAVRAAEFRAETARLNYREALGIDLPRKAEAVEQATLRQETLAAKTKAVLPLTLGQARRDFEKLKLDRVKDAEKLKKLEADRAALTVVSPIDGVVYYGRFSRGKWGGMDLVADTLRRGGAVTKNAVVMTVVRPRPLAFRATVAEADLSKAKVGAKGTVEAAAFPELKLPGTLEKVDAVPSSADGFDARLSVKLNGEADGVAAGMSGTAKLVVHQNDRAVLVPAKAVAAAPSGGAAAYVSVLADGKPQKRLVLVGRRVDDRQEIVEGLDDGDQVLLERPQSAPKAEKPKAAAKKTKKAK